MKNGIIHTIDINEELVSIQNKYFAKSKCNNSIIQHVGDARNIIKSINEKFDLVFLDADKENYIEYYELVIEKVKKGGLIIADNVLWTGKVVEPKKDDDELTQYLIDFNKMINEDDRVENIILPLRDGLNVILKKLEVSFFIDPVKSSMSSLTLSISLEIESVSTPFFCTLFYFTFNFLSSIL